VCSRASNAVYGIPNPAIASIASSASASFASATQELSADYIARRSIIIRPGQTPGVAAKQQLVMAHQGMLKEISSESQNLKRALRATRTLSKYIARVTLTPSQGTWESISSVASVKLYEGLSHASAQYVHTKPSLIDES